MSAAHEKRPVRSERSGFFFTLNGPEFMFACFYVPDFPVQAALLIELPQARNVFKQSPLAILDGPANLPRVFA